MKKTIMPSPSLSSILNIVIRGEYNFCCLCFNTDQNIDLHDGISIKLIETDQNVAIANVLQSIFGKELQDYLSIFENICEDCLKSIISIYTFIQKRHCNAKMLMQALNGLNNSIEYTTDENGDSKSLYVAFNLENFTSHHIYDRKKLSSTKTALKRFKFLNMPKTNTVFTKKRDSPSTKPNKKDTVKIRTSDMVLDPNDQLLRKCKVCLKAYNSLWNLRNHFLKFHAPKDYKCPKCPKVYGSPHLVDYHVSVNHCDVICSECGKTFKNSNSLKRHEWTHHVKLVCPDCGRIYKSKVTYKKHVQLNVCKQKCRANPANAQFTCDYCGKKYTQKMSLRVHIQYNHGNYKAHICEWCGKKFWAQSRLKAHIVKHTREKNFTCSICQGKFVTKESLLYHTRLHTGEKPYECSKCNCSFISASRRTYHMKTYHLLASEECDICHSKFSSRVYLDKHKKSHKQSQDNDLGK